MRNSRGEYQYRESYDRDNFHFIRQSGLKPHDFEGEGRNLDAVVGYACIVVGVIAYVGYVFLGWANL